MFFSGCVSGSCGGRRSSFSGVIRDFFLFYREIQQKVYLKWRILQERIYPPPVHHPRGSIDIRFHQPAQPLHKQMYATGEIAPMGVDKRDRQRLGAVLGQDLRQVAGA